MNTDIITTPDTHYTYADLRPGWRIDGHELVRQAQTGDRSPEGNIVDNKRGNLWWGRDPQGAVTLLCLDPYTPKDAVTLPA